MENKIKALFFAQYLGQIVYNWQLDCDKPESLTGGLLDSVKENRYPSNHLLLRDISQLTDDEYEISARDSAYRLDDSNIVKIGKSMVNNLFELNNWSGNNILKMTDYLRSIGVLLPFTYLNEENKPVTLTPADIVSRGWCKLKTT